MKLYFSPFFELSVVFFLSFFRKGFCKFRKLMSKDQNAAQFFEFLKCLIHQENLWKVQHEKYEQFRKIKI